MVSNVAYIKASMVSYSMPLSIACIRSPSATKPFYITCFKALLYNLLQSPLDL
jgi:hypothetical protein